MKKRRLFIFIAMLISLALVGCGISGNTSKKENQVKTEIESVLEKQNIKASVVVKYSEKEIIVFSNTTCFFNLEVTVSDGEYLSENTYGEFQIKKGEILTLTLKDLSTDFFSDEAIIKSAKSLIPYVYCDSSLSFRDIYKDIDCEFLVKCSSEEVVIYSDSSCYFDLTLWTEDADFKSTNEYVKLEISAGETISLTLEDLAPGFFSDTTKITKYSTYIEPYTQK